MKFNRSFICLLLSALMMISCGDDEGATQMHLDREFDDAPLLGLGEYEFAARFIPSFTNQYSGRSITGITYYLKDVPFEVTVIVYEAGTANEPGEELYSSVVTTSSSANSWNTHNLSDAIPIPINEDIWVAVRVSHVEDNTSVGCDSGQANPNGDHFWSSFNSTWERYLEATNNETSINWNIRAILDE